MGGKGEVTHLNRIIPGEARNDYEVLALTAGKMLVFRTSDRIIVGLSAIGT
jgi:hypothetical protein